MQITNYEGLILQSEINELLKEDVNLTIKYKLSKLLDKVTSELKTFDEIRTQAIRENTSPDGIMDVQKIEDTLNPIVLEKINIDYKISLSDISVFSSDKVPQVLFKFVEE